MRSRPTRVVVTGAGGWLGQAVVAALSASAYEITALRREDGDLATPGVFARLLGEGRSTAVIHLAASLDRSGTMESDERQWRDTFGVGREVIQGSARAGVTHIIAAGSMDELGTADGVLKTTLPARPMTMYGLCKALVREVAEFETRRTDIRVDWFRPTIVYGPGQRGPMLIPSLCRAAHGREVLDVTDGLQKRDFLFVDDLVDWILLALGQDESGFVVHHLGSAHPTPVREVLDAIEASFPGAVFRRGARPRRAHEPDVQVAPADGSAVAGWRPRVPLEAGLRSTVEWWRNGHA